MSQEIFGHNPYYGQSPFHCPCCHPGLQAGQHYIYPNQIPMETYPVAGFQEYRVIAGILAAVGAVAQVADAVNKIKAAVSESGPTRSGIFSVYNNTDSTLVKVRESLQHGSLYSVPAPTIPPGQVLTFSARDKSWSIATGTEGTVVYSGDGIEMSVYWNIPFAGSNGCRLSVSGPKARQYTTAQSCGGGNTNVEMKYWLTRGQRDWRFCRKCFSMFFDGYADKGNCAAGGGHEAQGYNFVLPYNTPETPKAQANWEYCVKCHVMFYNGYPDKGRCPAGGAHQHHPGAFHFTLPHDVPASPYDQGAWEYCLKCYAMYFNGYPTKGKCPAGGEHTHHPNAFHFVLPHNQ